jgi:hypothetical protein
MRPVRSLDLPQYLVLSSGIAPLSHPLQGCANLSQLQELLIGTGNRNRTYRLVGFEATAFANFAIPVWPLW